MITAWPYWLLLATAVPVYWWLPDRFRLRFLAATSFLYLLSLTVWGTLALLGWSLAFFYLVPPRPGSPLHRAASILTLGILGYLIYFKYIPPIVASLGGGQVAHVAVPLGLSYFTFKLIHYRVEARRGNIKAHGLDAFLSYMFLFPIFTAGPIERFDHYLANIAPRREGSTVEGLTRIAHGLIKQFVVNGMFVAPLLGGYRNPLRFLDQVSGLESWKVWVCMLLMFVIMYLDFSAYSDIAIGSARLFGIRIMENFNWPLLAPNIGEFWKRWHMTLAGWCQTYVYLPTIGLTRNPYLAVYSTFVAMGLWHAGSPHWVAWGLYHATGVTVCLSWLRYRRRRGWRFLDGYPWRVGAIAMTVAFVSAGSAMTLPHSVGGTLGDTLNILKKLLFLG